MNSMIETIKQRYSVRTYDGKPVEEEKLRHLRSLLGQLTSGPFGNRVRLEIVDMTDANKSDLRRLGSYGIIRGPVLFFAGVVRSVPYGMEDFAFCMERAVLEATALGLGTVWLGGFINRGNFAERLNAAADEVVPAVSPLGYADTNRSAADIVLRSVSEGVNRKNFGELFFEGLGEFPLEKSACGPYGEVLESVRRAPSASNKQPWRIFRAGESSGLYHLYLKEDRVYNNAFRGVKIQNLDMGIAMCHFEEAAHELGLAGGWQRKDNPPLISGLKYIASWTEK